MKKTLFLLLSTILLISLFGCNNEKNKDIINELKIVENISKENNNKTNIIKNENIITPNQSNSIYTIDFYDNDMPEKHYFYQIDVENKKIDMEIEYFSSVVDEETNIVKKSIVVEDEFVFYKIIEAYNNNVMNSNWSYLYCNLLEDIELINNEEIMETRECSSDNWDYIYTLYDTNSDDILTYKENFYRLIDEIIYDLKYPNSEMEYNFSINTPDDKPVIYLYPKEETRVKVTLDYNGKFTTTYPQYNNGWEMIAKPNGTLIDPLTNKEYYCLFWEGFSNVQYDLSKGFVIKGKDTRTFLETSLKELGLNEREINEFIIYWLPKMEHNPYNLITFQNEKYIDNAKLDVSPTPDSTIRVFMVWKGLETPINIEPQELETPQRDGFVVVEWGGKEIK